jgi:hypothetical protein
MDSDEFSKLDRDAAVKTALWPSDMQEVLAAAEKLKEIKGIGGVVTYFRDDGEELAVIWWDGESETWLVNWLRGSGA